MTEQRNIQNGRMGFSRRRNLVRVNVMGKGCMVAGDYDPSAFCKLPHLPIGSLNFVQPCAHCYCMITNDGHRVCCNCGNRQKIVSNTWSLDEALRWLGYREERGQ